MTQQITANDIPHTTPATVKLACGWTAKIETEYDETHGAPWEEEDGHGPVSDWRPRPRFSNYDGKRAGERVLSTDRSSARYYDFAEAVRIARKDGWECAHGVGHSPDQHVGKAAMAACAAEQDFKRLQAWCNDEWSYIGVIVTVMDAEGEQVEQESLWGVESDGDYWREVAAELVNGIISGRVTENEVASTEVGA